MILLLIENILSKYVPYKYCLESLSIVVIIRIPSFLNDAFKILPIII